MVTGISEIDNVSAQEQKEQARSMLSDQNNENFCGGECEITEN
jgi:hypothetical protein